METLSPELHPRDIHEHSPNLMEELIWNWIWNLKRLPKNLTKADIFPKTAYKYKNKSCSTSLTIGERKIKAAIIHVTFSIINPSMNF